VRRLQGEVYAESELSQMRIYDLPCRKILGSPRLNLPRAVDR